MQRTPQVEEPFPSNDPEPPTNLLANKEDVGAALLKVPSAGAAEQQSTQREHRSKRGHDQLVKSTTTSQKQQLPPRFAKSRVDSKQKGPARKTQSSIVASILVDCATGVLLGVSSNGSRDGVSSV